MAGRLSCLTQGKPGFMRFDTTLEPCLADFGALFPAPLPSFHTRHRGFGRESVALLSHQSDFGAAGLLQ